MTSGDLGIITLHKTKDGDVYIINEERFTKLLEYVLTVLKGLDIKVTKDNHFKIAFALAVKLKKECRP